MHRDDNAAVPMATKTANSKTEENRNATAHSPSDVLPNDVLDSGHQRTLLCFR
jgi:hypothetical protein